jgi:hypothetical protein
MPDGNGKEHDDAEPVKRLQDWNFAKEILEEIFDIDPLNHRTPSPPPENWDCPPTRPKEDQAAPHVTDLNFDRGNIRQLPPAADFQE